MAAQCALATRRASSSSSIQSPSWPLMPMALCNGGYKELVENYRIDIILNNIIGSTALHIDPNALTQSLVPRACAAPTFRTTINISIEIQQGHWVKVGYPVKYTCNPISDTEPWDPCTGQSGARPPFARRRGERTPPSTSACVVGDGSGVMAVAKSFYCYELSYPISDHHQGTHARRSLIKNWIKIYFNYSSAHALLWTAREIVIHSHSAV